MCLDGFEAEGDRVPKLLPCSHTLCVTCLRTLAETCRNVLCPVCRAKHRLSKGREQDFPINR